MPLRAHDANPFLSITKRKNNIGSNAIALDFKKEGGKKECFFPKLSFPIVLIILLFTIIGVLRAEPSFAFYSEDRKGGSDRIVFSL